MRTTPSRHLLGLAAAVAIAIISFGGAAPLAQTAQPPQPTGPEAAAFAGFMERVTQYVELQKKLEATLPKLPDEATPQQIHQNERALGVLIQAARKAAKRGDLFTPEMTVVVKGVTARVFGGPEGQKLRSSIMDENVAELPLTVNQRYPDAIPMATMPPALLKALPTLPENVQYRFVASQFVLLDTHSHLVADFIPGVLSMKRVP